MSRKSAWVIVVFALNNCCHARAATSSTVVLNDVPPQPAGTLLAAALIAGDEGRALKLTQELLASKGSIEKADLKDDRRVAPNILLRATYDNRDYQLGVDTVSEYALCLLQIKYRTSSENILRVVAPALQRECSEKNPCEVCNAQAFPVRVEIKQQLVSYWFTQLRPGQVRR